MPGFFDSKITTSTQSVCDSKIEVSKQIISDSVNNVYVLSSGHIVYDSLENIHFLNSEFEKISSIKGLYNANFYQSSMNRLMVYNDNKKYIVDISNIEAPQITEEKEIVRQRFNGESKSHISRLLNLNITLKPEEFKENIISNFDNIKCFIESIEFKNTLIYGELNNPYYSTSLWSLTINNQDNPSNHRLSGNFQFKERIQGLSHYIIHCDITSLYVYDLKLMDQIYCERVDNRITDLCKISEDSFLVLTNSYFHLYHIHMQKVDKIESIRLYNYLYPDLSILKISRGNIHLLPNGSILLTRPIQQGFTFSPQEFYIISLPSVKKIFSELNNTVTQAVPSLPTASIPIITSYIGLDFFSSQKKPLDKKESLSETTPASKNERSSSTCLIC
jgi:hypothetical protein